MTAVKKIKLTEDEYVKEIKDAAYFFTSLLASTTGVHIATSDEIIKDMEYYARANYRELYKSNCCLDLEVEQCY